MDTNKLYGMHFGYCHFTMCFFRILQVFLPVRKYSVVTYDTKPNLLNLWFSDVLLFMRYLRNLGFKDNWFFYHGLLGQKETVFGNDKNKQTNNCDCQKIGKINCDLFLDWLFTTFRRCQTFILLLFFYYDYFVVCFLEGLFQCFVSSMSSFLRYLATKPSEN